MARLIHLKTFSSPLGNLTVIEDVLPFEIKRVFYIYGVADSVRGKHRHRRTVQAAVCIRGSCTISNNDGKTRERFVLDSPEKCLILEPRDWHYMHDFTEDAILMVLASTPFDPADYIYEDYPS